MRKVMVALRDRIAGTFMQPFFVPSLGVASRTLGDEIARKGEGNILATHPGDFELYELGHFHEETGVIHPHDKPEFVMQVSALVQEQSNA